jgi:aspartate kinase
MSLIVQKFGGSSVSTVEKIQAIADKIIHTRSLGHRVVVVVSAMGGETDRLINMAHAITPYPDPREYDMLASSGEQVSVSLLAMALIAKGCPACSLLGYQAGIKTNGHHSKAQITQVETSKILKESISGKVVIVAGFQGVTESGDITTLGRGGSDTTAVALAVALQAIECQICTDVEGVHTTDPRYIPEASCLREISFEEMLAMSRSGAKVLHPEAIAMAGASQLPLRILSTFSNHPGTLISYHKQPRNDLVKGIAFKQNLSLIHIQGIQSEQARLTSELLQALQFHDIEVENLVQHTSSQDLAEISLMVSQHECARVEGIAKQLIAESQAHCSVVHKSAAQLSIIGLGIKSCDRTSTRIFSCLSQNAIHPLMTALRENEISITISSSDLIKAVKLLHYEFELHKIKSIDAQVA